MKRMTAVVCAAMLAVPAMALAGAPGCDSVNFSQDVMTNFPRIKEVCQTVKEKDGKIYVLFVGDVVEVNPTDLTVHVRDKSNKDAVELKLGFDPNSTLMISGGTVKFNQLKKGDKLDFWIEHARWGLYSKPGASALKVLSKKEL